MLRDGAVIDPDNTRTDVTATRLFNDKIRRDDRVEAVMLGIADGLTICRKL